MPDITALHKYLETADLPSVLRELGAENAEILVQEIRHFTEKEAKKRDEIVLNYFGKKGINQITNAIVKSIVSAPRPGANARILDMGAGSAFFTVKVASKLKRKLPNAVFYAMDATPAMLLAIARKTKDITPFFGIAENIAGSINHAEKYTGVPKRFDAVFSTLMLHHCPDIEEVFQSIRQILSSRGKAVIVDLCTHTFNEFKQEMGDLHLGFDPEQIRKAAKKAFTQVSIEKIPGITCESSGRSAELFISTLKP